MKPHVWIRNNANARRRRCANAEGEAMSIDSTGGLLSPENIQDVLTRSELYREIRAAQSRSDAPAGWSEYEVQAADALMPELIAYKVYKLDTLKWVVMIAASLDNPRDALDVGKVLFLPGLAWLRERIRYYMNFEKLGGVHDR